MPRSRWNAKDERMYNGILRSCRTGRKKRSLKVCKRIAAATTTKYKYRNKRRRKRT